MSSFQIWCLQQVSKLFGRGHVYHGVAPPLIFKTVWRRLVIEVMSFWSFGLEFGLILAWYSFPAAEKLLIFCLIMCQIFPIGERSGLQAGQFSTRTLLLRSHAVVIYAVCGFVLSCWNTRQLEGSICCSKNFKYLSAFIVPSKICRMPYSVCTYSPSYHQRCWLLNWCW